MSDAWWFWPAWVLSNALALGFAWKLPFWAARYDRWKAGR